MKEFEKWWEMEGQNLVGCGRITDTELAEEVWKAALKWVKKEAISLDERGDGNRAVIDRELSGG